MKKIINNVIKEACWIKLTDKKPRWFRELSEEAQKIYMKDHPNSALAKGKSLDAESLKKMPKKKLPTTREMLKMEVDTSKLSDGENSLLKNTKESLQNLIYSGQPESTIEGSPNFRLMKEIVNTLHNKATKTTNKNEETQKLNK